MKEILIHETEKVKDALKQLDKTAKKVLLVVDPEGGFLGTITDGDIRRHILKGESLDDDIRKVYNKRPVYLKKGDYSPDEVRKLLLEKRVELVPIVDEEDRVVDFITWEQMFSEEKIRTIKKGKVKVPVVIMAGGKGTRLEPFTRIIPKTLIPVGDKSIIEMIIDNFKKQGIKEFYLTLNYKGEMIKSYLNSIEKDYVVKYIL